jgi:hypothetical protein
MATGNRTDRATAYTQAHRDLTLRKPAFPDKTVDFLN